MPSRISGEAVTRYSSAWTAFLRIVSGAAPPKLPPCPRLSGPIQTSLAPLRSGSAFGVSRCLKVCRAELARLASVLILRKRIHANRYAMIAGEAVVTADYLWSEVERPRERVRRCEPDSSIPTDSPSLSVQSRKSALATPRSSDGW